MSESAPAHPEDHLRADAARNVQRIVEVAAGVLARDRHAGMTEVAVATGLGRATVYRHFRTRAALLEAIWAHAVARSEAAMLECRLDEGTAAEALSRLLRAWLDVRGRYAVARLMTQPDLVVSDAMRDQQRRTFGEPLRALLARGQAEGTLAPGASVDWAARVFGALLQAADRAVSEEAVAAEDAADLALRTFLDGFGRR